MKIIESQYVSIGQAAKIIGLSIPTLRRYEKLGKLDVDFRTFGNHRRYHIESLKKVFSKNNQSTKTICYARVSSAGQKDDQWDFGSDIIISNVLKLLNYTIIYIFSQYLFNQ